VKAMRRALGGLSPAEALVLYYAGTILAGTLLLASPPAGRGAPVPLLDALFTATSAQCVTGLTVVDTGTRFTFFGQCVILALIQVGGLGITTFSVYLLTYLRVGVGARGRSIIHETLMPAPGGTWRDLVRSVFALTLAIEAAGAVLLAAAFVPHLGLGPGLYSAVFHSVSAFCNAGFSLFPDNLVGYRGDALVNLTVMALIVLGGIGFLVMQELLAAARARLGRGARPRRAPVRLSLHTKVVLVTSALLIVGGAALIAWLERHGALAGMGAREAALTAFFQSVTARTAGFNTVDLNAFHAATIFVVISLMFVGASPGSAGGGVKTTSLAVFFAVFANRLRGSRHTSLFRRTIPEDAIIRALSLVVLAAVLIGLALFGLTVVQSPVAGLESPREFLDDLFEAVSAFGTVGLSLGATARLGAWGKGIVILLMFVGRVGMLTMAFAVAGRTRRHAPRYAEETVMIG